MRLILLLSSELELYIYNIPSFKSLFVLRPPAHIHIYTVTQNLCRHVLIRLLLTMFLICHVLKKTYAYIYIYILIVIYTYKLHKHYQLMLFFTVHYIERNVVNDY